LWFKDLKCGFLQKKGRVNNVISYLVQELRVGVALVCVDFCAVLQADELAKPSGPVILTLSGSIRNTNAGDKAEFDRAMLEALGTTTRQMATPWTVGEPVFEGVKMTDVLKAVGANGDTVTATALNDYVMDIPLSDFENYPVILALKMNGEYMRIRDKGPLWIIYPHDEHPELDTPATLRKWVWQLTELYIHRLFEIQCLKEEHT
jgi:hypothetical protein